MPKLKKITLPKTYNYEEGVSRPEYKKFHNRQKLSYSQYTSFISDTYKGSYYGGYFLGIRDEGNIFSEFGSRVGSCFESGATEGLSEDDVKVIKSIEIPDNTEYEREIIIDMAPITGVDFIIQGFVDAEYQTDKGLYIVDFKTGSAKDKPTYYASDEYQQTCIYARAREDEGEKIAYCGVVLLGRKGNGSEKHPLRLDGEIFHIPTPYTKARALNMLKEIANTAIEISEAYKVYQQYFCK